MNMSVRQRTAIRRSTSHLAEGRRMRLVRHLVPALVAGLFWAVPLSAQQTTGGVTGKVVDASTQQPLANVEVAIAGTPHRELTRADGSFTLNGVPAGAQRLRASRIGYGSQIQEITVTPGGTITAQISLAPAAAILEPVVVTGYGTQRREAITGSVSTVSAAAANVGVITNVDQMIQARAAGVEVTRNNGEPGAGTQILIRGGSSISNSNDPLYVIDGVPIYNVPSETGRYKGSVLHRSPGTRSDTPFVVGVGEHGLVPRRDPHRRHAQSRPVVLRRKRRHPLSRVAQLHEAAGRGDLQRPRADSGALERHPQGARQPDAPRRERDDVARQRPVYPVREPGRLRGRRVPERRRLQSHAADHGQRYDLLRGAGLAVVAQPGGIGEPGEQPGPDHPHPGQRVGGARYRPGSHGAGDGRAGLFRRGAADLFPHRKSARPDVGQRARARVQSGQFDEDGADPADLPAAGGRGSQPRC